jgi:hypothetical protein
VRQVPLTAKQIQNLTGCSKATSYRWIKDPKFDASTEETVLEFARQKELSRTRGPDIGTIGTMEYVDPSTLPDVGSEGAAAALRRLQSFERQSGQLLQAAMDAGDAVAVKRATAVYNQNAATLMKFELAVAAHERDTGSLIPRSELLNSVRTAATWIRLAWASWVSSHLSGMMVIQDQRIAKEFILKTFTESLQVAIANSADSVYSIPPDCRQIILQEYRAEDIRDTQFLHHSEKGCSYDGGATYERA